MILITGAAGKTGRSVIKGLLGQGKSIRAFVHRPDQVDVLKELGVTDIIFGDILDENIAKRACLGVESLYHIPPNMYPQETTIGENLIQAARAASVGLFAYHSVLHPQIEAMPHHWQKMRVEESIFRCGLDYVILQPVAYMQNVLGYWKQISRNGVYRLPYRAETRLGMVDLEEVGEVAAHILCKPEHYKGGIYELCSTQVLSQNEVVDIIKSVIGKNVRFEVQELEQWEQIARQNGLGEYQIDTLLKMFAYYDDHGFWGSAHMLTCILGRTPHTFEEFLRRNLPLS